VSIVYHVKFTKQEFDAIKDAMRKYNEMHSYKIVSIHHFIKIATSEYIKQIDNEYYCKGVKESGK